VLAVDDDPINRQLIYDYLIVESFSVRLAVDGQDALECIEDELPDIILLDIMMPGMNGFDCCKTIRKKYDALSLPIIMLSAKSQTNDIVKGLNQGANDYLVKPFHKSELIARIQNNLQAKQSVENMKEARLLRKEILYRKEVENKLDIANRRLTRMLDCSDDAFLMIDHKGDVLFFNQSAEKFFGFQINELTKKNVKSLFDQSFMDSFQKSVNLSSDSESHIVISDASVNCYQEVLKRTIFLSGFMIPPKHGCLCAPMSAQGEVLGMIHLTLGDTENNVRIENDSKKHVIESKLILVKSMVERYAPSLINLRLRETLKIQSIRDPLTGLYNRRHMQEALEREARRVERYNKTLGIIMIDVDHFKAFNDTYGHEAGDSVLKELGAFLRQRTRGEDIACRYGGEEFILILTDADIKSTKQKAEEIRKDVKTLKIKHRSQILNITASLGVAIYPIHGVTTEETLKSADMALYQAKENGRDQVAFAS
jgi:diguanylate cyclase (GGDEF)-like protein